ncbi:MAG: NAD(P)/FAD-dependent oxidoreductase [Candidatus Hydrogenedentes bacterium]|nr:NAD(P)/FAD-dependent oxidoreductase [Candidatus Hydrogenedentota bacterium]
MHGAVNDCDLIILGAGAAGLMCAIAAGRRGRRVALLERNAEVGEKIRISGGGRCNFTNVRVSPENYVSQNHRFCTSALSRYSPADFIAMLEHHRIPYHEKKLGQLFCDTSARDIIQMRTSECRFKGVALHTRCDVESITKEDVFNVATKQGAWNAPSLVIATGGLSIPKLGATDLGYRVARQFGLNVITPEAALVPLRFSSEDLARYDGLSGVSFDALVSCRDMSFRENVLFTHRGLSGPAILQISSYWKAGDVLTIDMLPSIRLDEHLLALKRKGSKAEVGTIVGDLLPKRLAQRWSALHSWSGPLNQYKDAALLEAAKTVHGWRITPSGTEGFAKAEVTRGGVDTAELSPKTMESKRVPGLYFIGEVVDVTGWLGGYNFQWAWASGHAAGLAV